MNKTMLISLFLLSACSPSNSIDNKNTTNNINQGIENAVITTSTKSIEINDNRMAQPQLKTDDKCSINFPKAQEHLMKAPCLTFPVKMSNFTKYPKLKNGYLDLEKLPLPIDNNEYLVSDNYERTRILGILPYDDTRVFLLLISNLDMEGDGFGQTYDLQLYNRYDGSYANGGTTYIGSYSLFYEEPLNYLYDTTQSFKFEDVTHLQSVGYCEVDFEINKSWEITQHNICKNFSDTENYLDSTENLVLNTKEMYFE